MASARGSLERRLPLGVVLGALLMHGCVIEAGLVMVVVPPPVLRRACGQHHRTTLSS